MTPKTFRLIWVLAIGLLPILYAGCRRNSPPASQSTSSDTAPPDSPATALTPQQAAKFWFALATNDVDSVRQFLKAGADPNQVDDFSVHPLSQATENGNLEMMTLLLDAGAKVDPNDPGTGTPLRSAAYLGKVPAMELLIKHGAQINPPPGALDTPLLGAAMGGHADAIRCLLKAGADPNAGEGSKPFYWACARGSLDCVTEFLKAGVSAKEPASGEFSPIVGATEADHWDIVRLLIEKGADPNAKDLRGRTPLHEASLTYEVETVQFLLAHGAKPDAKDGSGRTPLDLVMLRKDTTSAKAAQVIQMLKPTN